LGDEIEMEENNSNGNVNSGEENEGQGGGSVSEDQSDKEMNVVSRGSQEEDDGANNSDDFNVVEPLRDLDEQELLVRNLLIPSDADIAELQLDESEIKNVEKVIWIEAPFMSAFATLLQKEVGDVNRADHRIPAFVFGPTLLLHFGNADEVALKALFEDFFPERVLFFVLNNAQDHYVVVELKWFDTFVTVYDSARSVPKDNGNVNMRDNCALYIDVPVLERIFRALQQQPEMRMWRFAWNMPQQNNGRDCGIFAMEVARTRIRAAMMKDVDEQTKADVIYQRLQAKSTKKYRRRLADEFRTKEANLNAKP
jgi:hypothetical protein